MSTIRQHRITHIRMQLDSLRQDLNQTREARRALLRRNNIDVNDLSDLQQSLLIQLTNLVTALAVEIEQDSK